MRMRRPQAAELICTLLFALAVVCGGCAAQPEPVQEAPSGPSQAEVASYFRERLFGDEDKLPEIDVAALYERVLAAKGVAVARTAREMVHAWLHAYVMGRIVPLTAYAREPLVFGPWSAAKDHEAEEASSDGSLTEWDERYYITHDWSEYGKQILTVLPQDTVRVNGVSVVIEGAFDYPKEAFLEEVREATGKDTYVFQTCEPNSDLNRIVYGRAAS